MLLLPHSIQAEEGKKVSDQLLGQWGIDEAKMTASLNEKLKDDPDRLQGMLESVKEMASQLVIEFSAKGKVIAYTPYETDRSKFKLSEVDEKSGGFSLKVERESRDPMEMKGKISGDALVLKMPEPGDMHLRRLKKNEAAKMIDAIEKGQAEKRAEQDAPDIKIRPKQ